MPVFRRFWVGLAVAAIATLSGGQVAGAQAACSTSGGLGSAQVTIDSPAPNESVSGTINVRGSAHASGLNILGSLNRVEVTLGTVTKSQTFDPGTTLNFTVPVDTSTLAGGTTSLRVVACGTGVSGERSINVNVAAPGATTTAPRATTTTSAAGGGTPPTTVAGATSTSVAAGAAGAQAAATTSTKVSTTTTTAAPTTTEVATTVAPPTTLASGRQAPLVLTETPTKSKSGAPVWVGAVVGISGGLGLLFSARPWRRRGGPGSPGGDGGGLADVEEPTQQLVR